MSTSKEAGSNGCDLECDNQDSDKSITTLTQNETAIVHYLQYLVQLKNCCINLLDQNQGRRKVEKLFEMWTLYDIHIGRNGKIDIHI